MKGKRYFHLISSFTHFSLSRETASICHSNGDKFFTPTQFLAFSGQKRPKECFAFPQFLKLFFSHYFLVKKPCFCNSFFLPTLQSWSPSEPHNSCDALRCMNIFSQIQLHNSSFLNHKKVSIH